MHSTQHGSEKPQKSTGAIVSELKPVSLEDAKLGPAETDNSEPVTNPTNAGKCEQEKAQENKGIWEGFKEYCSITRYFFKEAIAASKGALATRVITIPFLAAVPIFTAKYIGGFIQSLETLSREAFAAKTPVTMEAMVQASGVMSNLLLFAGIATISYLAHAVAQSADQRLSNRLQERIREKTALTIEKQSLQNLTGERYRETMDLVNRQYHRVRDSVQGQLGLATNACVAIAAGVAVASYSGLATGALVLACLPHLLSHRKNAKNWVAYHKNDGDEWKHLSVEQQEIAEKNDLQELKTLGLVSRWVKSIKKRTNFINTKQEGVSDGNSLRTAKSEIGSQIGLMGALLAATGNVLAGKFDVGTLTSVFYLCRDFSGSLQGLSESAAKQSENVTFVKDVRNFVEASSKKESSPKEVFPLSVAPSLDLKEVRFSYGEFSQEPDKSNEETFVLNGVTLHVNQGEYIGLVGENGAGKTTLMNLILGLLEHDRATTADSDNEKLNTINFAVGDLSRDVGGIDMNRAREDITCLAQEFRLFWGKSIRENIEIGLPVGRKPALNLREVLQHSGLVVALKLNTDAPEQDPKLDQAIGNWFKNGVDLSGGQKQQVAFARALYRGGSLFIFDEPTSHLDPWNSKRVLDTIEKLPEILGKRVTRIMITHNYHILEHTERNIVMEKGDPTLNDGKQRVTDGNHQQLMELCPFYRDGYETFVRSKKK